MSKENPERFQQISAQGLDDKILEQECKSTKSATKSHINLLKLFMKEALQWDNVELDDLPKNELTQLIRHFLAGVRKENGSKYEPGTIENMWYSFKRYFKAKGVDLDSDEFSVCKQQLAAECKNLFAEGKGTQPNKSNELTPIEVDMFFERRVAGNHHPEALRNALVIFVTMLGRRGSQELRDTLFGDLKIVVVDGTQYLTLDGTRLSKARKGKNPRDIRNGVGMLAAQKDSSKCPVALFLRYSSMRPPKYDGKDSPLFLTHNNLSSRDPRKSCSLVKWYKPQPCGKNKLTLTVSSMVKTAGMDVGVRKITNSSIRKLVVCSLKEAGCSESNIKAYTGHKRDSSLQHYDSLSAKKSHMISGVLFNQPSAPYIPSSPPPVLAHTQQTNKGSKRRPTEDQPGPSKKNRAISPVFSPEESWALDLVPDDLEPIAPELPISTDQAIPNQQISVNRQNPFTSLMGSHNVFSGNVVINYKN